MNKEELNSLSAKILDSSIAVHKTMGPGLLETVYNHCCIQELRDRDIRVDANVMVPLIYKERALNKDTLSICW